MDLWQNAARRLSPDADEEAPPAGADKGNAQETEDDRGKDITETRRLAHPPGSIIGVNKPDLGRKILDFKDERFSLLAGEVGAALHSGGLVIFTAAGEAMPVATVLLGTAAGLLAAGEEPLIIVDVEYPYHGVCTLFQMEGLPGLSELLAGRGGPGDLIFASRDPIAGFLCPGRGTPSIWDLIGAKMQNVLRLMMDVFGRIFMLAPPLGEGIAEGIATAANSAGVPATFIPVQPAELSEEKLFEIIDSLPACAAALGRVLV